MLSGFLKSNRFHYALIVTVILSCGIYFRLYPAFQNIEKANILAYRIPVASNIKRSIQSSIDKRYPNIPANKKKTLVDSQFRDIVNKNPEKVLDSARELWKRTGDDLYKPYLLGADSYYYHYLADKIIRTGSISDNIQNGKYFEPLMMAPRGHWRAFEIHPYIGFFLFKGLAVFSRGISLVIAESILPIILYSLSVIVFLLISNALNIKKTAVFIGGIFLSLSPIFLERSCYGWFDTDPYNVLFLLLSIFFLLSSFRENGRTYSAMIFLAVTSGVYALLWQGWIILPVFIIVALLASAGFSRSMPGPRFGHLKRIAVYAAGVIFISIILITPRGVLDSLKDIAGIASGFLFLEPSLWPDIFLTVGELKNPSLMKMIHILGGMIFLPFSLAGFGYLLVQAFRKRSARKNIVVCSFFLTTLIMALNGQRFIIFFLPACAICFVSAIDAIIRLIDTAVSRFLHPSEKWASASRAIPRIVMIPLIVFPILYAHISAGNQRPLFDLVWERSLEKIRTVTPADAIISTWWPPGHFIKAMANRAVTFDGATLNTPQAYWMANLFLAGKEEEALGILRMLNQSGNEAAEYLTSRDIDLDKAVSLIKTVSVMSPRDARDFLKNRLSEPEISKLLDLTNSSAPPPSYLFIYKEMVDSALGLHYVKNWDFRKAMKMEEERGEALRHGKISRRGSTDNISSVWSVSGGMPYVGKEVRPESVKGDVIKFPNGVLVNRSLKEVWIEKLEGRLSGVPESLVYLDEEGNFQEKKFSNSTVKLSVLLIDDKNGSYRSITAPPGMIRSILFRLYYLDGASLNSFKKIFEINNPVLNNRIILYKADWTKRG